MRERRAKPASLLIQCEIVLIPVRPTQGPEEAHLTPEGWWKAFWRKGRLDSVLKKTVEINQVKKRILGRQDGMYTGQRPKRAQCVARDQAAGAAALRKGLDLEMASQGPYLAGWWAAQCGRAGVWCFGRWETESRDAEALSWGAWGPAGGGALWAMAPQLCVQEMPPDSVTVKGIGRDCSGHTGGGEKGPRHAGAGCGEAGGGGGCGIL